MSFIEEIFNSIRAETTGFRFTVADRKGGYFEGVSELISFNKTKIEMRCGKTRITITGENMYIGKFSAKDLTICGNIIGVERH